MTVIASLQHRARKILTSVSLFTLLLVTLPGSPVQADSITDLKKQQEALQQQAAQATAQAQAQQSLAERAAASVVQVTGQITNISANLQSTQKQIGSVQQQIADKDQQIAALQAALQSTKDQQNALVRELYIMTQSHPDSLDLFSSESVSIKQQRQIQLNALEKAASLVYDRTQQSAAEVTSARNDLQRQNEGLASLKTQQQNQKSVLADVQATQQALHDNATVAEQKLEAKAAAAKAQAAQIAARIQVLSATSNWGNQIVSSNDGSWYYSQTGDYTLMGGGPYTVSEVGCLITSIAMVSTYYGHHISPDYIARNGSFSDGYLVGLPSGLGITLHASRHIDWSVVNNEISNNRPVIISIYLPSVGAVNSDGSSHFIVIKGVSNGKYLMHDPIGAGRSYNLNQVRSMILVNG
ncbi:MAG: C39 family peptidase [bacterium]